MLRLNQTAMSPELLALLERAKNHTMSKEERATQCKSWVVGEFMLEHPEATLEYAESIYDKISG